MSRSEPTSAFVATSIASGTALGVATVIVLSFALALYGGLDQIGTAAFAFLFIGLKFLLPAAAGGAIVGLLSALVTLIRAVHPMGSRLLFIAVFTAGMTVLAALTSTQFYTGPESVLVCALIGLLVALLLARMLRSRDDGKPSSS